jgi:hypothetical protein
MFIDAIHLGVDAELYLKPWYQNARSRLKPDRRCCEGPHKTVPRQMDRLLYRGKSEIKGL